MKHTTAQLLFLLLAFIASNAQQITIPRIEQMPDMPQPYEMRDWKAVSMAYDSLVFNLDATGLHLPLSSIVSITTNYPAHPTFGIQSYVGTNYPPGMEAINVIPAVVGASLVGLDKSNQYGHDWVLYCEEYFNRRPAENVYLNGPIASSGHDWWYETMPNIFFYQLNKLYPHTGDFDYQFVTIAERWLEAVKAMGGSNVPWQAPYMNYRAFSLSSMTPLEGGVKQPEAAGAIAWILFNAYSETGQEKYRIGAEWCLEFLSDWEDNPSYEIQLPYGVYMAARMNALLKTDYDVEKMLNWCFDVGDLRGWGAIVGNWGGIDASGLIGEAREDFPGYAFNMNGYEHVGALVPMCRYDDRFARAISKWVLNVANASRLYYSNFLPDGMQDNEDWTAVYDPESFIAYEALREQAAGPYGTGDAMGGGWAQTNLGLYGSSHVGILGAIIQETNIEGILQLDMLATDYYGTDAFITYLYYNPHQENKSITVTLPAGSWDIYDAVSNQIIASNLTGMADLLIVSDNALMTVLIPAGSNVVYDLNKAYVNDTIIDFNTGESVSNYPPRIKSLAAKDSIILINSHTTFYCTAVDPENTTLSYAWQVNAVQVAGSDSIAWQAPADTGTYIITCQVNDQGGLSDQDTMSIKVVQKINYPPHITAIKAYPRIIKINESSDVICHAFDPNDDEMSFEWSAQAGAINGSDSTALYSAPGGQGNYYIYCKVTDSDMASSVDSLLVLVKDPAQGQSGELVAKYEFNNSAWDYSGFGNHGTPYNTLYVNDMHEEPESAIRFYQSNSNVIVNNTNVLNFRDGISVSFWLNIAQHYDREAYPVSHGNWTSRWKISIGDKRIRFTVNGTGGIVDIDSEELLEENTWYHLVAIYNGTECQLLLNGELDAVKAYQGQINTTTYDLILGQSLPSQSGFNYNGAIDNLRIYNYGISYEQVQEIYEEELSTLEEQDQSVLNLRIYPNPCSGTTRLLVTRNLSRAKPRGESRVTSIDLYEISGVKIKELINELKMPGAYEVEIDVSNVPAGVYFIRLQTGQDVKVRKLIVVD